MSGGTWPNLVSMFFDQADRFGDAPLLWAKKDGAYRLMSWRQVADQVGGLRRGLKSLGVEPGDRVVVVSENRPEWLIADLAIMAAGAITVPAYVTNTVENHLHVLVDSGAETAIVSTDRLAGRLLPAAEKAPDLRNVVIMSPLPGAGGRAKGSTRGNVRIAADWPEGQARETASRGLHLSLSGTRGGTGRFRALNAVRGVS